MRASIPAKKGEFSAYRDRTTNRAPIRPSDHRRVVANQVQRIAAPTRIGYSNAHVSVILPYSGPWCAPVTSVPETGSAYLTSPPMATGARSPASANAAGPIRTISAWSASYIMTATTITDRTPTPRPRAEPTMPPTQCQPGHRPGEEGSREENNKGHQLDFVDRFDPEHHHPLSSVDAPAVHLLTEHHLANIGQSGLSSRGP